MFFLYTSCENTSPEDKLFPIKKNIIANKMNIEEILGKINFMKCVNNYLVFTGKNLDFQTQCQLINKETKESYFFGERGEGPGKLLQSTVILQLSDVKIGIYDLGKRTLFSFFIDSIISKSSAYQPEVHFSKLNFSLLSIGYLEAHRYVATGLTNELKRFMILDENGIILSMEGELPPKTHEQTGNILHSYAYWGQLTTNAKEKRTAICTNYAGIIQIYDLANNEVQLIKEHNLFFANYDDNNGNLGINSKTRWGYLSIDSNDNYIFALYSGINQVGNEHDGSYFKSNIIHVFDWNGNPVCQLLIDKKMQVICVDDSNLYGYDPENGEILIVNIMDI